MKNILRAFLPFAVLLMGVAPLIAAGTLTIDSPTSLFINPREGGPIQKAAQDLASDLQKVFGRPVQVVHDPSQAHATSLWISDPFDRPEGVAKPSRWERLHIQAVNHPWPGSPAVRAVVLGVCRR